MLNKFILKVTEEDIKNGVSKDGTKCPIALAVRRIFPNASMIEVDGRIYIDNEGNELESEMTFYRFITDFDDGLPVFPFEQIVPLRDRYERY